MHNYGTRLVPAVPSPLVVVVSAVAALLAVAGASVPYRQQRRLWRFETTTGRVVSARVERHTPRLLGWGGGSGTTNPARGDTAGGTAGTAETDSTEATNGDASDGSNRVVRPVVEYEYRAGAQRYANDTVWPAGVEPTRRRLRRGNADFVESVVERFPEGEPVTVYHDPDDPEDAFLVPTRNWVIPVVCFLFVVVLAIWTAHCTGAIYVPVGEFNC